MSPYGSSSPSPKAKSGPNPFIALSNTDPSAASYYTTVNQLLNSAAVTEADAYQQYYSYAAAADQEGYTDLARVWREVGRVEHQDHYTHEITLSGLYSGTDDIANLKIAITQAKQAAKAYERWADEAPDGKAAHVLRAIAERQTDAAHLLTQALKSLEGKDGSVPAAPEVEYVQIEASPEPHYSGTFYTDLTGDSDSAMSTASWLWAEYQFMAKVAVSTGQADLGKLLAGLEEQEQQNWNWLSNLAGYVNGIEMNLQVSIASEQSAIDMYTAWATRADQLGNPSTASTFRSILTDEQGHHQTFTTELEQVTNG
jgi:rubrerythrin